MANDLERFLQQAAERLAKKVNESKRGAPRQPGSSGQKNNPPRSTPSRPAPTSMGRSEPEIIEAVVLPPTNQREPVRREQGPDPLSTIDTRPQLAQEIDQADERMSDRLHDVFDHQISKLPQASTALSDTSRRRQDATSQTTEVQQRAVVVHPIVALLRRPEAIKNAFVISEIFNRRF